MRYSPLTILILFLSVSYLNSADEVMAANLALAPASAHEWFWLAAQNEDVIVVDIDAEKAEEHMAGLLSPQLGSFPLAHLWQVRVVDVNDDT
ncbi:MAG: hypothetical protein OHK0046_15960 [Anaerolineae bacterium]